MSFVKIGVDVTKDRPAVFFGHQSREPDSDQRFVPFVSLSYTIEDADGTDVTSRFPAVGGPGTGGIPPATTVVLEAELEAAELFRALYFAEFQVPLTYAGPTDQVPGTYYVVWAFETEPDPNTEEVVISTSRTWFTLIDPSFPIVRSFVQVQDAIDEGFPVDDDVSPAPGTITSTKAKSLIEHATKFVRRYTGIRFGIYQEQNLQYSWAQKKLRTGIPIIGISDVLQKPSEVFDQLLSFSQVLNADTRYEIFNRHIRFGTTDPDDRRNPLIQSRSCQAFPAECSGKVLIDGVFGYTEEDDLTIWGQAPRDVVRALLTIAASNGTNAWTTAASGPAAAGGVAKVKTFDQEVTYDSSGQTASNVSDQGLMTALSTLDCYKEAILVMGIS